MTKRTNKLSDGSIVYVYDPPYYAGARSFYLDEQDFLTTVIREYNPRGLLGTVRARWLRWCICNWSEKPHWEEVYRPGRGCVPVWIVNSEY